MCRRAPHQKDAGNIKPMDHRSILMSGPALGTNLVTQVGIVVRDVEARSRAWSQILGLPIPDIIITDAYDKARTEYNGRPTPARAKLAFFNMGQVSVELIEPIDGPSIWKDQLDQHGDSIHHIAFVIKGTPCPAPETGASVCIRTTRTALHRGRCTGCRADR
ncbi:MAG: VOC family protein [Anaerolineae bacterium]